MKRERERETWGDDERHSLADVPRAVCVTHKWLNHKKHTIAAKPSLKLSAKTFPLVDCHAKKRANKRPPFQTLVTILTTAFTHFSWWRVLSSAIRSLDKTWGEKKRTGNVRKNKEMKRRRSGFCAIFFWRTSEAKKSEKKKKNETLGN